MNETEAQIPRLFNKEIKKRQRDSEGFWRRGSISYQEGMEVMSGILDPLFPALVTHKNLRIVEK